MMGGTSPFFRSVHFFPTHVAASRTRYPTANHCHPMREWLVHGTYVVSERETLIFARIL